MRIYPRCLEDRFLLLFFFLLVVRLGAGLHLLLADQEAIAVSESLLHELANPAPSRSSGLLVRWSRGNEVLFLFNLLLGRGF